MLLLASTMAASCAPSMRYAPETASAAGYYDRRIAGTTYEIGFSAPSTTPIKKIELLVLRHAAEFALLRGYPLVALRDREVRRDVYVLPIGRGGRAEYKQTFGEWHRFWRAYCAERRIDECDVDPLWPSKVPPRRRIEVIYTVELCREGEQRWDVLDAAFLLETLGFAVPPEAAR